MTHLIGMTICSFQVGLEPSTVDVRNVLSRKLAVTNGLTFALRCTVQMNRKCKINFEFLHNNSHPIIFSFNSYDFALPIPG